MLQHSIKHLFLLFVNYYLLDDYLFISLFKFFSLLHTSTLKKLKLMKTFIIQILNSRKQNDEINEWKLSIFDKTIHSKRSSYCTV